MTDITCKIVRTEKDIEPDSKAIARNTARNLANDLRFRPQPSYEPRIVVVQDISKRHEQKTPEEIARKKAWEYSF